MTFRVLGLAVVLVSLGFQTPRPLLPREPKVWIERTNFLKVTAEKGDERIRVCGALYGVGGTGADRRSTHAH